MPLSAGDKLGHFDVVGAIGQGGMGEVYKARDTRLDRTVAIKVLHGLVSSDPALRERFEREARWMLPLDGEPLSLVATEASERAARLTPNGRWLAYVSDENGRDEIYVQAFPGPEGKQVISTDGGRERV